MAEEQAGDARLLFDARKKETEFNLVAYLTTIGLDSSLSRNTVIHHAQFLSAHLCVWLNGLVDSGKIKKLVCIFSGEPVGAWDLDDFELLNVPALADRQQDFEYLCDLYLGGDLDVSGKRFLQEKMKTRGMSECELVSLLSRLRNQSRPPFTARDISEEMDRSIALAQRRLGAYAAPKTITLSRIDVTFGGGFQVRLSDYGNVRHQRDLLKGVMEYMLEQAESAPGPKARHKTRKVFLSYFSDLNDCTSLNHKIKQLFGKDWCFEKLRESVSKKTGDAAL